MEYSYAKDIARIHNITELAREQHCKPFFKELPNLNLGKERLKSATAGRNAEGKGSHSLSIYSIWRLMKAVRPDPK